MNELTMELDGTSRTPLYEQIYNYIRGDIQCGKIEARQKLPSTRALASFLQVSRSTVDLAYEQLLSEGYIESARTGAILYVRSMPCAGAIPPARCSR